MLGVDRLEVSYGPVRALRGVSLTVAEGEMVSVVGPNGAGKSTLLLAIAGALAPSDGEIRFKEQSILGRPTEAVARLGISLVPEGRNIFTQLTVEENLRLGTQMRRDKDRVEQDFAEMLAVFPILGRAAKITNSEPCIPFVIWSRSEKPVSTEPVKLIP